MADQPTAKKKKPAVKNLLASPFISTWPCLDKDDNKSILDGIRRIFPPQTLQRGKEEQMESSGEVTFLTWEIIKKSFVFGINEVTKALERDKLILVLVCRSTKPCILTNHLIPLSATRSTPACALFGLSDVMAPLLGIKTVAACGVKKGITMQILKDLVEFVVCKTPPLTLSWLEMWRKSSNGDSDKQSFDPFLDSKNHDAKTDKNIEGRCSKGKTIEENKKDVDSEKFMKSVYAECHIKTFVPSEKPKVKKSKVKKSKK